MSPPAARQASFKLRSTHMRKFVSRFAKNDSGVTALEYGILAALITALSIPTIALIGPKLHTAFLTINGALP